MGTVKLSNQEGAIATRRPPLRCHAGPLSKRQRPDAAATQRHAGDGAHPRQNPPRPGADRAAPRGKTAEEVEDEEIMEQLAAQGIYDSPPDAALDAAVQERYVSSGAQPSQNAVRTDAARAAPRAKTAEELEDEEIMRLLAEKGIYDSQPEVSTDASADLQTCNAHLTWLCVLHVLRTSCVDDLEYLQTSWHAMRCSGWLLLTKQGRHPMCVHVPSGPAGGPGAAG